MVTYVHVTHDLSGAFIGITGQHYDSIWCVIRLISLISARSVKLAHNDERSVAVVNLTRCLFSQLKSSEGRIIIKTFIKIFYAENPDEEVRVIFGMLCRPLPMNCLGKQPQHLRYFDQYLFLGHSPPAGYVSDRNELFERTVARYQLIDFRVNFRHLRQQISSEISKWMKMSCWTWHSISSSKFLRCCSNKMMYCKH